MDAGGNIRFSMIAKNNGFLFKSVPFAYGKAISHFMRANEAAEETGAKSIIGQACHDLDRLYLARGQAGKGRECLQKSMEVFDKSKAVFFLERTREAMERSGI